MGILILLYGDMPEDIMKIKILILFASVFFLASSCNSTHISYTEKKEIKTKLNIAIENSKIRSKENSEQFEKLLRDDGSVNDFSDELIKTLLDNEYKETDFNKLYNVEIEKVLMQAFFNKESDIYLGDTVYKIYVINGIKYFMHYLCENPKNYPNLYTDVYIYDSQRKKMRVFYKVNYNLEYQIYTDGINSYKVFI